jgi:hypothetical protein
LRSSRAEGPQVAGIRLDHVSVIATEDTVLVMPAERVQDVKARVATFKSERRNTAEEHLKAHCGSHSYQTICRGEGCHVKKIVVEPRVTVASEARSSRRILNRNDGGPRADARWVFEGAGISQPVCRLAASSNCQVRARFRSG